MLQALESFLTLLNVSLSRFWRLCAVWSAFYRGVIETGSGWIEQSVVLRIALTLATSSRHISFSDCFCTSTYLTRKSLCFWTIEADSWRVSNAKTVSLISLRLQAQIAIVTLALAQGQTFGNSIWRRFQIRLAFLNKIFSETIYQDLLQTLTLTENYS